MRTWKFAFQILLFTAALYAQNYSNNFFPIWQDTPWGEGGLTPTGVVWSLDGIYDFDQDGQGEFFLSSSWSGAFGNDAMLYESTGNNTFAIAWYYWFNQLDTSAYNSSVITTGDLDNDNQPELIVLNDCYSGQDALYIFEYDPLSGTFPAQPTTTWDVNLPGGVEESGDIAVANLDDDPRPELMLTLYSRNPGASHVMIVELLPGSDLDSPAWHVEMDDDSTLTFLSYMVQSTDLDQDGLSEVLVTEWNFNRLLIWENTAEDHYQKASDLFLTQEPSAFSNEGAAEMDLDGNGWNELFLASTTGYFWVVTNNGSVNNLTFAQNVHLLSDYKSNGGWSLTQVKVGNADTPVNSPPDRPDIYLCATDTTGSHTALFDWEYLGGDVIDPNNYSITTIFSDTVTNGEMFKISKMGIGNSDGDTAREIIIGSYSFALNRPHIYALESEATTALQPPENHDFPPNSFILHQNFPNPFNPGTTISFELFRKTRVILTIFDPLGREIMKLVDNALPAGTHKVVWDGRDPSGNQLPSGVYFYQLKTGTYIDSKKMLLIR